MRIFPALDQAACKYLTTGSQLLQISSSMNSVLISSFISFLKNWKTFPFLNPRVSERSLVSSLLVERFCLYKGIFKAKHIAGFKKTEVKPAKDLIIDSLGFTLDNLNDSLFENSISKASWQTKLESLKDSKEPDFPFAIFQKEFQRILQPPKPHSINH